MLYKFIIIHLVFLVQEWNKNIEKLVDTDIKRVYVVGIGLVQMVLTL